MLGHLFAQASKLTGGSKHSASTDPSKSDTSKAAESPAKLLRFGKKRDSQLRGSQLSLNSAEGAESSSNASGSTVSDMELPGTTTTTANLGEPMESGHATDTTTTLTQGAMEFKKMDGRAVKDLHRRRSVVSNRGSCDLADLSPSVSIDSGVDANSMGTGEPAESSGGGGSSNEAASQNIPVQPGENQPLIAPNMHGEDPNKSHSLISETKTTMASNLLPPPAQGDPVTTSASTHTPSEHQVGGAQAAKTCAQEEGGVLPAPNDDDDASSTMSVLNVGEHSNPAPSSNKPDMSRVSSSSAEIDCPETNVADSDKENTIVPASPSCPKDGQEDSQASNIPGARDAGQTLVGDATTTKDKTPSQEVGAGSLQADTASHDDNDDDDEKNKGEVMQSVVSDTGVDLTSGQAGGEITEAGDVDMIFTDGVQEVIQGEGAAEKGSDDDQDDRSSGSVQPTQDKPSTDSTQQMEDDGNKKSPVDEAEHVKTLLPGCGDLNQSIADDKAAEKIVGECHGENNLPVDENEDGTKDAIDSKTGGVPLIGDGDSKVQIDDVAQLKSYAQVVCSGAVQEEEEEDVDKAQVSQHSPLSMEAQSPPVSPVLTETVENQQATSMPVRADHETPKPHDNTVNEEVGGDGESVGGDRGPVAMEKEAEDAIDGIPAMGGTPENDKEQVAPPIGEQPKTEALVEGTNEEVLDVHTRTTECTQEESNKDGEYVSRAIVNPVTLNSDGKYVTIVQVGNEDETTRSADKTAAAAEANGAEKHDKLVEKASEQTSGNATECSDWPDPKLTGKTSAAATATQVTVGTTQVENWSLRVTETATDQASSFSIIAVDSDERSFVESGVGVDAGSTVLVEQPTTDLDEDTTPVTDTDTPNPENPLEAKTTGTQEGTAAPTTLSSDSENTTSPTSLHGTAAAEVNNVDLNTHNNADNKVKDALGKGALPTIGDANKISYDLESGVIKSECSSDTGGATEEGKAGIYDPGDKIESSSPLKDPARPEGEKGARTHDLASSMEGGGEDASKSVEKGGAEIETPSTGATTTTTSDQDVSSADDLSTRKVYASKSSGSSSMSMSTCDSAESLPMGSGSVMSPSSSHPRALPGEGAETEDSSDEVFFDCEEESEGDTPTCKTAAETFESMDIKEVHIEVRSRSPAMDTHTPQTEKIEGATESSDPVSPQAETEAKSILASNEEIEINNQVTVATVAPVLKKSERTKSIEELLDILPSSDLGADVEDEEEKKELYKGEEIPVTELEVEPLIVNVIPPSPTEKR